MNGSGGEVAVPPQEAIAFHRNVFVHRIVIVEVGETAKGPVPYSVVKRYCFVGKLGPRSASLSQQVTQSRKASRIRNKSTGVA